jgi:hypothetical protein
METARCCRPRGFLLEKLTNEEVRKAVELFWTTFLAKSEDLLNSYYAPGSTIFQISWAALNPAVWARCAAPENTSVPTRAWN